MLPLTGRSTRVGSRDAAVPGPLFLTTTSRASIYVLDPTAFEYHLAELHLSIWLEVSETKHFTTTMDSIIRSLGFSGT